MLFLKGELMMPAIDKKWFLDCLDECDTVKDLVTTSGGELVQFLTCVSKRVPGVAGWIFRRFVLRGLVESITDAQEKLSGASD
jgi:hypothetical protein